MVALGLTLAVFVLGGCTQQPAEPNTQSVEPPQNVMEQTTEPTQRITEEPFLLPIEKLEYVQVGFEETEAPEIARPETLVPYADTAIIGHVTDNLGEVQIDNQSYNDYIIEVDTYLFNPFGETTIRVRQRVFWTRFMESYIPEVGEELLLVLQKENDYFRIVFDEIYVVSDESVRWSSNTGEQGFYEPVSLDEALSKIGLVAKTWAGEELTESRKQEVLDIAFNEPGISRSLFEKDYQVTEVRPWVGTTDILDQKFYAVHTYVPTRNSCEYDFTALVNMTQNKLEDILWGYSSGTESPAEIIDIALSDTTVKELIGDHSYELARSCGVCWDSWQETWQDGSTFYIYPRVKIELLPNIPVKSTVLKAFVDLNENEVIKVISESWVSPMTLESRKAERDFTLTLSIPKAEYQLGETAEATLTLSYHGDEPVALSGPGGEYFNLLIKDEQGNTIYEWQVDKYGPPPPREVPLPGEHGVTPPPEPSQDIVPAIEEPVLPGQSITRSLQFKTLQAGELYIEGTIFGGWGFGYVGIHYPDGHGEGLYIDTPFIIISAE
jgi:hypothetical protein